MKRRMALVKRLWESLSDSDKELVAYLVYGGMDTVVGCVFATVTQKERLWHNDKYIVIDLKQAQKWAEYRIYTGHSAPRDVTREHSRDLVDYVQNGALAMVKPVLEDAKAWVQVTGKCIVLPLDLYLYLLAAAEDIASFGRYALPQGCATLRAPPTKEERKAWDEQWELVHAWLIAHWQKRCATLVQVFGHSAWRAYQKWRIPHTGYGQPPSSSAESEENLSVSSDAGEDDDIWRLIKENYGEKILK